MTRGPYRIRTQIAFLVLGVLVIAQAVSLWLFVDERGQAVQAAIGADAAGRAANLALLIEQAPEDLHPDIIAAANSPLVRFDLTDRPSIADGNHEFDDAVEARVRALLGDNGARDIRVDVHEMGEGSLNMPTLSPEMLMMHAQMMQGSLAAIEMELSISLSGGRWLNVGTRFERPPIQLSWASTASFGLTADLLLIASVWFLLTRLTGPLNELAIAAERLGRGASEGELKTVGPKEVRDLTAAFNRMQNRLTRFVADRTQMLAALAHDLRSPLTALRVRTEMVDDDETRDSLVSSVSEMQDMVEATLAYAKGVGQNEELCEVDLEAFLVSLRENTSSDFEITATETVRVAIQANAMRRALRNLINNAVRYGATARVGWQVDDGQVVIWIDDDGPGIPAELHEQVFSPYFRMEKSRSLDTGGHGLGLPIARSVILAHGGTITLENRPEGGLRVRVSLPDGRTEPHETGADTPTKSNLPHPTTREQIV